jgi:hypothetical protein
MHVGTTFSGFAWLYMTSEFTSANPQTVSLMHINNVYKYPGSELIPYPYGKTATSLFYTSAGDPTPLWGWTARYQATTQVAEPWQHQYRFKLRLANKNMDENHAASEDIPPLPPGKTTVDVIADYLRAIATYALEPINAQALSAGGETITFKDIKWCLTVPAQWSMAARSAMHTAAKMAGMVRGEGADNGGSAFPLLLVLEPEAASVFCLNRVANPDAAEALYVLFLSMFGIINEG